MTASSMNVLPVSVLESAMADHVQIGVDDYVAMRDWYVSALGFDVEVEWTLEGRPDVRMAYLKKNGFRVEFVSGGTAEAHSAPVDFADHFNRKGYEHLCFTVASVDGAIAELVAKGTTVLADGRTYPLPGSPFERRVGFVLDPEGNVIEFGEALRMAA